MTTRTIKVDYLARVEGEGSLSLKIEKGEVKLRNFQAAENKLRYAYVLTPSGIEAKARLTLGILKRKRAEYQALRDEIASLERDLDEGSEGEQVS